MELIEINESFIEKNKIKEIKKIGHRGSGKTEDNKNDKFYIENTIYAFKKGKERGLKCVELDIICTKDYKLIVFHDFFINKKFINELTLEEFKIESKIYSRKKKLELNFKEENIYFPTSLNEIINSFSNFIFNIEIKYPETPYELKKGYIERSELIKLILKTIKENNSNNKIFFSSFDEKLVILISENKIPVFLLSLEPEIENKIKFINEKNIDGLILPENLFIENSLIIKKYRKLLVDKLFGTYPIETPINIKYTEVSPDFIIID